MATGSSSSVPSGLWRPACAPADARESRASHGTRSNIPRYGGDARRFEADLGGQDSGRTNNEFEVDRREGGAECCDSESSRRMTSLYDSPMRPRERSSSRTERVMRIVVDGSLIGSVYPAYVIYIWGGTSRVLPLYRDGGLETIRPLRRTGVPSISMLAPRRRATCRKTPRVFPPKSSL